MTKKISPVSSVEELLRSHFDAHQKEDDESYSVERRAALIRDDLSAFIVRGESAPDEQALLIIDQVSAVLLQCLDSAMATCVTNKNCEPAEKILDLVAFLGCSSAQGVGVISKAVLDRTLTFTTVILERVRAQACIMLGLCMKYYYGEKTDMDHPEELDFLFGAAQDLQAPAESVERVKKALMERLTDKSQAVRNAAICASKFMFPAAHPFETEEEELDDLLDALLWNMSHDPSIANRIAVVQCVPMTTKTIDHVVDRVRDVKVKVRVAALEALRTQVDVTNLAPEQCAEVVRSGLSERCPTTRDAAVQMICAGWMKAVKYDPIALLSLLGPILYEAECTKVVKVLLDVASDNKNTPSALCDLSDAEIRAFKRGVADAAVVLAPTSSLGDFIPEAILFARVKCDWIKASTSLTLTRKGDAIARIIPDVPFLCETLEKRSDSLMQEGDEEEQERQLFISTQLLQLAQATELTEEGSRRHFIATMKRMLASMETHEELVEACIGAIKSAHEREVDYLKTINDILMDIAKVEQDEESKSVAVRLRIITMLATVLENVSAGMSSEPILGDFVGRVIPAVESGIASVREIGISCLGRLALLSSQNTVLEEFKPLLFRVATNEQEKVEIRAQAVLAICDLSLLFADMLHPCLLVSDDDEGSTIEVNFRDLLSEMLEDSETGVVCLAAEIAAKLLFAGRMHDPRIVSQLLFVFFTEEENEEASNDDDDIAEVGSPHRMQQLLSLFFPAYAVKSKEGRSNMAASVSPLLSTINEKLEEKGARVSHFPVAKLIEYVSSILDATSTKAIEETKDEDKNATEPTESTTDKSSVPSGSVSVSIEVAKFLLKESASLTDPYLRALCKTFGTTEVFGDTASVSELKKLVEELCMVITDTTAQKSLEKVVVSLESIDAAEEESSGGELDEESLADALEAVRLAEQSSGGLKENNGDEGIHTKEPLDQTGDAVTSKEGTGRASRSRSRLAPVN